MSARQRAKMAKIITFLGHLAESCNVDRSAKAAGIHSDVLYKLRKTWPALREAWDAAKDAAYRSLEAEAFRRARDGVKKPLLHQGQVVAHVRQYSDLLTMFLLKAHAPERFDDRVRIEHSGNVAGGAGPAIQLVFNACRFQSGNRDVDFSPVLDAETVDAAGNSQETEADA